MKNDRLRAPQLSAPRILKRNRRSLGFTLIEASISLVLMALLLAGSINLFISALRNSVDSNALVYANLDGANALQSIVETTREAYYFQLPDEQGFTPPAGATAGSYETSMDTDGASETICTGMLITMPNKASTLSVDLDNGQPEATPTVIYSRDQGTNGILSGQQIMYYRSDPNGNPDATAGTCLWALTVSDNDGSQPTINRAIIKSIAPNLPNAIQFVRPQSVPNAQGATTSIPFEVEIKIICSYYAPTGGAATNEVSNGQETTSLDGKCVFMRDHMLSATVNESGSTSPVNNNFMPSGP